MLKPQLKQASHVGHASSCSIAAKAELNWSSWCSQF